MPEIEVNKCSKFSRFYFQVYGVLLAAGRYQTEYFSESLLIDIVDFMLSMLETEVGRSGLDDFFLSMHEYDLVQVLMTVNLPELSVEYTSKVLQLFTNLFDAAEAHPKEPSIQRLCSSLARLSQVPINELESWLSFLVHGT